MQWFPESEQLGELCGLGLNSSARTRQVEEQNNVGLDHLIGNTRYYLERLQRN